MNINYTPSHTRAKEDTTTKENHLLDSCRPFTLHFSRPPPADPPCPGQRSCEGEKYLPRWIIDQKEPLLLLSLCSWCQQSVLQGPSPALRVSITGSFPYEEYEEKRRWKRRIIDSGCRWIINNCVHYDNVPPLRPPTLLITSVTQKTRKEGPLNSVTRWTGREWEREITRPLH